MADIKKTIEIIFAGTDKVSDTLDSIGGGLDKMAAPFADLAKKVLEVEAALAALAVGGFAIATKMTADFTDKMQYAKGVSGATEEEFQKMTATAKELGATTRWTASDAAEGLVKYSQAGFKAKEMIDALPHALNLAQAGQIGVAEATDIAGTAMKVFKLKAEDLQGIGDKLTATFTGSNSSLMEIGEAFKYIAPLAAATGGDIDNLLAAIGGLHDAGIKGSMAGTALRGSLTALMNPTKEEAKLIADLSDRMGGAGLQVKDAEGKFVGFTNIIGQLEKAGIKSEEAMKLFGDRAGIGMVAMLQIGSEKLNEFDKNIRKSSDGMGRMAEIAKTNEEAIGGALRSLNSAIEAVMLSIGTAIDLKPGLEGLTQVFRELSKAIELDTFEGFTKPIQNELDSLKGYLTTIAQNLPEVFKSLDFSYLIEQFGRVKSAAGEIFSALSGNFDLSTVDGMSGALQRVIDGFASFQGIVAGIISSWEPAIELFSNLYDSFTDLSEGNEDLIGGFLGLSQQAVLLGGGLVTVAGVISGLTTLGGALVGIISGPVGLIVALSVAGAALATFSDKIDAISVPTQGLIGILDDVFNFSGNKTAEELQNIDKAFENAKIKAQEALSSIEEIPPKVSELSEEAKKLQEKWEKDKLALQLDETSIADVKGNLATVQGYIQDFVDGTRDTIPDDLLLLDIDAKMSEGALAELDSVQNILLDLNDMAKEEKKLMILAELGDTVAQEQLDDLIRERDMSILVNLDKTSVDGVRDYIITEVGDHKVITYLETDLPALEKVSKEIETIAPDGTKHIQLVPIIDDKAKDKVDEQLKAEEFQDRLLEMVVELDDDQARIDIEKFKDDADKLKAFEIKAKLDTELAKIESEKFKTQAETIQTAVEWKAKLDIAEAEASAKTMESVFSSIQTGMESTASLMSDLFGALSGEADFYDRLLIEKAINQQLKLQEQEFDLQKELTQAQIKLLDEKRKLLTSGEGFKIDIKAEGLKPHLEMIWWDILEALQTQVNEEGGAMLLGI